jgi:beta-glucosidase
MLLAHGLAVQAMRTAASQPTQIGIALNLSPVYPASDSEADKLAACRMDGLTNRIMLDPLLLGHYPVDMLALIGMLLPQVQPGDFETISTPLDFIGVNYYSRAVARYDETMPILQAAPVNPEGSEYSQMWEIYPPGLYDLLTRLQADYGSAGALKALFVTENGICVPDGVDLDRRVRDERRIRYLHDHILSVHRAIQAGANVMGYLVWSLLDNFEWAYGYQMRFGLVHVDFDTQCRTVKDSGRWFAGIIRQNGIEQ